MGRSVESQSITTLVFLLLSFFSTRDVQGGHCEQRQSGSDLSRLQTAYSLAIFKRHSALPCHSDSKALTKLVQSGV